MTLSWISEVTVYDRAPEAPPPRAPTDARRVLLAEWRTLMLLPLMVARLPELARIPRGDGAVAIDIPGWKAPEGSLAPLRAFLRRKGHDAQGWGLGTNVGKPERDSILLAERVEALAAKSGRPVALVGWSLGGIIAREVARAVPHAVRRVITFGTPVVGGPTHTLGARAFGADECRRITALADELDRTRPITTPITAIFTQADRVVSWPACLDRRSPTVEHVEVRSTHLGMGVDPTVWGVIAERLAART